MILQNICRIQTIPSFIFRSSHPEVFLRKGVLKRCSKFTGENPCRSVISIKMLCNFIEMTLWHVCSPINLLHIFRTPFFRNTNGWLLLYFVKLVSIKTLLRTHEIQKFRFLNWMENFSIYSTKISIFIHF